MSLDFLRVSDRMQEVVFAHDTEVVEKEVIMLIYHFGGSHAGMFLPKFRLST